MVCIILFCHILVADKPEDIVSEMIWLQVHLGSSILCSSVPIYTGVEMMCCLARNNHITPVEAWLQDIRSLPVTSTIPRTSKEIYGFRDTEVNSTPCGITRPTTRAVSVCSTRISLLRRPSETSIRHGCTREILIQPDRISIQHDRTDIASSRPSSRLENATKRLIFEG